MAQVIFIFAMILAPILVDWVDRTREGDGANEAGRANE